MIKNKAKKMTHPLPVCKNADSVTDNPVKLNLTDRQ